MKTKQAVSDDVALNELESFINKFVKRPDTKSDLKKKYLDIFEAITDGYLVFGEGSVPTLKLKFPIKNSEGQVSISEINFKTRILPSQLNELSRGVHPVDELFLLQSKMTAFIIGQPVEMLDRLERYDLDVVNQLASVFS